MDVGFKVGPCTVFPAHRQVLINGKLVLLGGRAFDLLMVLVERRDRVVGKDELYDLIWPNLAIEPNNLPVQIWRLRQLLGSGAIVTIPRRGYRLTVPVEPLHRTTHALHAGAVPGIDVVRWAVGHLQSQRWTTIVGADTRRAQAVAHDVGRAFAVERGVTAWQAPAPTEPVAQQPYHAVIRRLQRIGGVVGFTGVTDHGRALIADWLSGLDRSCPLRVVTWAAAVTAPCAGEFLVELPH